MSLLRECGTSRLLRKCGTATLLRSCGPKLLCDVTGTLSFVFSGNLTFYPDICFKNLYGYGDFKVVEVPTGFTIPPNTPKATAVDITPTGKLTLHYYNSSNCTCSGDYWWGPYLIDFTTNFKIGWDIRTQGWGPTFLVWIWAQDYDSNVCLWYSEIPCSYNPTEGALSNVTIIGGCTTILGEVPPGWGSVNPICNDGTLTVSVP